MARASLPELLREIRACDLCADDLPLGPRPIVQWKKRPPVIIIGQAPGTKVHESGVPWDDDSGEHLRAWLNITRDTFYDGALVGLMPMGFCYPGSRSGGDAPPDRRCAPRWHPELLRHADDNPLLILVGRYAQQHYLGREIRGTLTETVHAYRSYLPHFFPLPHPSWRSKIWMQKNPWFARSLLPRLRKELRLRLGE